MTRDRLWQTLRLWTMLKSTKRVAYLKKKKIFGHIGEKVTIMDRKIPLYANLIRIHNNVRIASNVTFVTHDVTHTMLNNREEKLQVPLTEQVGCIEIMDNVFVGTNATLLYDVRIGPNAIVAAGAVVTKDVPPNTVVGGVPARVICTLDEYLERRSAAYAPELQPKGQKVSSALEVSLWNAFLDKRANK